LKTNIDYGFELEFFAADFKNKKVFNATKLIEKHNKLDYFKEFGPENFILTDPSVPNNHNLIHSPKFDIISDGTVFEVVTLDTVYDFQDWLYGFGKIKNIFDQSIHYVGKLFDVACLTNALLSKDQGWQFIDPGVVYSSNKMINNAYTGEWTWADKKEETEKNKEVSFRAAGFHIHIAFPEKVAPIIFKGQYAPKLCNELVKQLDEIYDKYFPNNFSINEELRNSLYATKGNYRLKYHNHGFHRDFTTLEYRQFSSEFMLLPEKLQKEILIEFDKVVQKFVKNIK